jgi:alkylated DNA repair dioxygenase AlkB
MVRSHPYVAQVLYDVRRTVDGRVNFVLINRYPDGKAAIGWHSDSEAGLIKGAPFLSLNVGAERQFTFRAKMHDNGDGDGDGDDNGQDRKLGAKIQLEHGSLLRMNGTLQETHEHQLPRSSCVHGERFNLTMRCVLE